MSRTCNYREEMKHVPSDSGFPLYHCSCPFDVVVLEFGATSNAQGTNVHSASNSKQPTIWGASNMPWKIRTALFFFHGLKI